MPRATFCPPQVASFGLTEEQAREEGYDVKVAKFPFTANGKAHGLGEPSGFVKLIADAEYGELLGAHLIGPDVSELLPELTLAQKWDLTATSGPQRAHPPHAVGGAAGSLPRPGRPHDQLLILRDSVVAGIGGLVVGHILWLIVISVAMDIDEVSTWVLVVAALVVVGAAASAYFAWKLQRRKAFAKAAFLWGLPIAAGADDGVCARGDVPVARLSPEVQGDAQRRRGRRQARRIVLRAGRIR